MTRTLRSLAVASAAVLLSAVFLFAQKEAKGGIESKIALESSMEGRLKQVLTEITGTEKIIVIVNVQLAAEKTETEARKKDDDFILPGVPIKDAINQKQVGDAVIAALGEDTRTLIKKLTVTIILDKGVSQSVVNVVKEVATGLMGIETDRGDQLVIKQMNFQKNPFYWGMLFYPPNIYWIIIIIAGTGFVLALVMFLFGPLKGFSAQFISGIMAAASAIKESGRSSEEETFSGGAALAAEALPGPGGMVKEGMMGREEPFSFVNEGNFNALMYLIRGESPQNIASIVNYLSPALASKVISGLAPDKQKEVGRVLAQVVELDPSELDGFEAKIRKRIAYLSGGAEKLTNILDFAGDNTRNAVLDSVKAVNPQAAEQVKRSLVSLDILADLDASGISTLIKAATPAVFARILKSMGEEFKEKVLTKLPAGAAERIRQEIEMGRDFNPARLETEKRRLIDIIRKFEARGLITRN